MKDYPRRGQKGYFCQCLAKGKHARCLFLVSMFGSNNCRISRNSLEERTVRKPKKRTDHSQPTAAAVYSKCFKLNCTVTFDEAKTDTHTHILTSRNQIAHLTLSLHATGLFGSFCRHRESQLLHTSTCSICEASQCASCLAAFFFCTSLSKRFQRSLSRFHLNLLAQGPHAQKRIYPQGYSLNMTDSY